MAVTFLTDADRAELERMILEQIGGAVTIESILQSTADGGENVVTFSDGSRLVVRNGQRGSMGRPGAQGMPGADARPPVRGVDYWTEEDKAEIIQEVLNALEAQ